MQFAGGVTADQLRPMALEEDAVAVSPVGADGTALQLRRKLLRISIPMSRGWLAAPAVKAITIWPLLLAVAVKVSTRAASFPTVRIDVEVGEHGGAVDGHVEFTISRGA